MDDGTALGVVTDGLVISNQVLLTGNNDPVIDTGAFSLTLAGAISGAGFITKQGTGELTLSAANTYSGATDVAQGTLKAGAVNTLSSASAHSVAAGATLDLAGLNQSIAGMNLAAGGTVRLHAAAPGATPDTTLTVTGPWVGAGGTLQLSSALGGNSSPTDRLLLSGAPAVASGKTAVQITNIGGLGGMTTGQGIEIIATEKGASIDNSAGAAFTLAASHVGGHVDVGAYEYRLNTTANGGYLTSTNTTPVPPVPVPPTPVPPTPVPPVPVPPTPVPPTPVPPVPVPPVPVPPAPVPPTPEPLPAYRAEVPLFAALPAQLRQASLTMLGNLHQRVGDEGLGAAASAPVRQAWGRLLSTDLNLSQSGTVSPNSEGRLTGFQTGSDVLSVPNWRAGVYLGQLDGTPQVSGFASGVADRGVGSNDLHNQYLAAYGTYRSDSGFYADAVLQAGRHRTTLEPLGGAALQTKGSSVLASLELGQAYALTGHWTIEPQLQLVHQGLSLEDSAISGAQVQQGSNSAWLVRAGLRVKGELATRMGSVQPYGRLNLYRASSGSDQTRFVGPAGSADIATQTGYSSTELAAGATLALSPAAVLYGEVGKLFSSGGEARVKSGVQASVGVRVRW